MTDTKKNIIRLSLRSKLIIILSLVVITVSLFLLYFTASMIIKDKRAYLYDTALANLETISGAFEQFTDNKSRIADAYADGAVLDPPSREESGLDPDLFQVHRFTAQDLEGQKAGVLTDRVFLTEKDKRLLDRKSPEEFVRHATQESVVYTNFHHFSRYKKKHSFLLPPVDEMKKMASSLGENAKALNHIYYRESEAPRLLSFRFDSVTRDVLCFDFLFDTIVEKFINKTGFENYFMNAKGEVLFQNKPNALTHQLSLFFKRFTGVEIKNPKPEGQLGVREITVGDRDYIFGYKRLMSYPDFFILSGIKSTDAYEVTTLLIINTFIYVLMLVGVFNISSLFLARTMTNPIEKFIDVIRKIADGNYQARVGEQNTSELQVMANTFNRMVDKIEDYNNKLVDYNRTLEMKVDERTASLKRANTFIKTMVDSLAQGLLVFDRKGICLDLYTRASEKLLGEKPSNKKLSSLLSHKDPQLFDAWVEGLFDEMIPFESLVELGPKSLPEYLDHKDVNFRHVTLEYFPMRTESGSIENVVMVATDKTKEYKAQKQIVEEQNYVKLVTKVIKDKENFLRFVKLYQESFKAVMSNLSRGVEMNPSELMRLLHSMKGSAAFFSLQDVVNFLHEFETKVEKESLDRSSLSINLQTSLDLLDKNVDRLKVFFGDEKEEHSDKTEMKLRTFYLSLKKEAPVLANSFAVTFFMIPVKVYVEQYKDLVAELSQHLGKKISPLEVRNGDFLVDSTYFRPFFDSCIHLFRNAVDHGIEAPVIRKNVGKDERGTVLIQFEQYSDPTGDGFVFQVKDDGGGIDPKKIRQKLISLNYSAQDIEQSDEDIIYRIFDESFSTAEQVTDLSGRGVGLYDVKMMVEKLGGEIQLISTVGKGTLFSFKLPIPK